MQPYLIRRKRLRIYFPTNKYPFRFPDNLFICSSRFFLQLLTRAVSIQLYYCRYQPLSHSPCHQNFGSYFSVFRKCGVIPHRLYRNLLTLMVASKFVNYVILRFISKQQSLDFKKFLL